MLELNTFELLTRGGTVQCFPVGNFLDVEETLRFADLQGLESIVETFPLDDAQKAFGEFHTTLSTKLPDSIFFLFFAPPTPIDVLIRGIVKITCCPARCVSVLSLRCVKKEKTGLYCSTQEVSKLGM